MKKMYKYIKENNIKYKTTCAGLIMVDSVRITWQQEYTLINKFGFINNNGMLMRLA